MLDRRITSSMAMCHQFYCTNKQVPEASFKNTALYKRLFSILKKSLLIASMSHEDLYPGWYVDEDNPGYLFRTEGNFLVRVPFHVVAAFPSTEMFESIYKLSRKVKTTSGSALCLSGSLVIIRAASIYSDIDFCEYVPAVSGPILQSVKSRLSSPTDLMLTSIKYFDGHAKSFSGLELYEDFINSIDAGNSQSSALKFDYVLKTDDIRPIDVSNVVILCDEHWQSASKHLSFAAQEALLDPVVIVPNNFCDPYEVGRYIQWIVEQLQKLLAEKHYTKFLKRALSLSRILFLTDITNQIKIFIRTSLVFIELEIANITDLSARLEAAPERQGWIDDLAVAIKSLQLDIEKIKLSRAPVIPIETFCEDISVVLLSFVYEQSTAA